MSFRPGGGHPTRRHAGACAPSTVGLLVVAGGMLLVVAVVILALWATPPSWLLAARQRTVGLLEGPGDAVGYGAAAMVAGILTPLAIGYLDRRRVQPPELPLQASERAVLLGRVRHKWITGVLEPSLASAARLALGLGSRADSLQLGTRTIRRSGQRPVPMPPDTTILEVFDRADGGLLLLGAPGVGKTTLLLELASALLDRAERDPDQPVPVVVNLASWASHRGPLSAWLASELVVGYKLSLQTAAAWAQQGALTLLLDGLDEITGRHRAACVEAINAYRHQGGRVGLVVCARTEEFLALAGRLGVQEAVELHPATDAQVDGYLAHLQAAGTPLAEVRAALQHDPTLQDLLRCPLLLHVAALAFHGRPAPALLRAGSLAERQARLWAAYLARMLGQDANDPDRDAAPQQARGWLAWLARALRQHDQTELQLDRLRSDWLAAPAQQRRAHAATRLLGGLQTGLPGGLLFGLLVGLCLPPEGFVVGFGLAGGLAVALVVGLAGQLHADTTEPTDERRWSAPHALGVGLAAGLVGGLLAGLVFGPGFGVLFGLGFGLLGGLLSGSADTTPHPIAPTQPSRCWGGWPRLRLVDVLLFGLLNGLGFALVYGLVIGVAAGLAGGLGAEPGLGTGLAFGLGFGIGGGWPSGWPSG